MLRDHQSEGVRVRPEIFSTQMLQKLKVRETEMQRGKAWMLANRSEQQTGSSSEQREASANPQIAKRRKVHKVA